MPFDEPKQSSLSRVVSLDVPLGGADWRKFIIQVMPLIAVSVAGSLMAGESWRATAGQALMVAVAAWRHYLSNAGKNA